MTRYFIHSEIFYTDESGMSRHSDTCPPGCSVEGMKEKSYHEYIHAVLQEWLDKSDGTGGFYIKNSRFEMELNNEDDR